jgi:hypothetical protein
MEESKHWGRKQDAYAFLTQIKASCPFLTKLEYDSRIKRTNLSYFYFLHAKITLKYGLIAKSHYLQVKKSQEEQK